MALKFVSGIEVTNITLSSYLDLAKQELRNAQIHNLSTTQINAISSPVQGQVAYDTTLDVLKIYDGANWDIVGAPVDDSTIEISSGALQVKDGGIAAAKLASSAVTSAKIAADAVTGAKIADDAIDSEHYTDGSIDAAHLASNSVTSVKIANDAVTAAKLADTAVTAGSYTAADITIDAQGRITAAASGTIATSEIADDAVTAAKLADTAVTAGSYTAADITIDAQGRITAASNGTIATAEIADSAVTNAKMAANSVDSDQYVDGSIDEVHIGDGAVTSAKIADNNVGATQLNVVGTGTSGQVLASDGDGSFSWQNAGSDVDVSVANLIARLDDISADFQIGDASDVQATFSGDVVVTGDLTINGTTTTVNSTTVTIDDPVFTLGGDTAPTADDNKDRGIEFRYYQSSAKVGFFGMDETDNTFKFIPDATNTSEVFSGEVGDAAFNTLKVANITLNGTAISSTAAELNILDGVTATATELNILDGVTSTTAELNILDGVTATTAELNIMDGVTATTAELNIMDGVTATTAELNYVDGVTSNIQTQLNGKQATITGGATTITGSNLTASRALVSNSSGKVAVSAVTSTELGYLDGVTSAVQTQIDTKAKYYKAEITITSGTHQVDESTHGISYPAIVQLYNANTGAMVLADIVQSTSGENDITINAADDVYDIIISGRAS